MHKAAAFPDVSELKAILGVATEQKVDPNNSPNGSGHKSPSPDHSSLAASLLSAKAFGFKRSEEKSESDGSGDAFGDVTAAALKALGMLNLSSTKDVEGEKSESNLQDDRGEDEREVGNDAAKAERRSYVPPPLPLFKTKKMIGSDDDDFQPPQTGIDTIVMWPPPFHIDAMPKEPEPLVPLRDNVLKEVLKCRDSRNAHPENVLNRVVYDSIESSKSQLSMRDRVSEPVTDDKETSSKTFATGRPGRRGNEYATLYPWYVPASQEDTVLVFESRFEGGNCRRAIQVFNDEYDIVLKPDINTTRHTQWFYFECRNTRAKRKYKFNIINLLKSDSLYNYGLRPLLYSKRLAEDKGIGWHRCGVDICYYANASSRLGGGARRKGERMFYTLTFTVEFPHDHDTIYLAYCYPYSYTDLKQYLHRLESDPERSRHLRRRPLCFTLAGNPCDLLTVTTFEGGRNIENADTEVCSTSDARSSKESGPKPMHARKGVVVSARVHPGESNASWMMKGFIDYLTGPSVDAKILRDNFVFKIVPMLNPDGVVVGNHRCSLAGIDLNRSYMDPSRKLHPTIFYIKQMIKRFAAEREVVLSVDLHGHSKKMNIFVYGVHNNKSKKLFLKERVFPRILWKNANVFSFKDSTFGVRKSKETTARVVVRREMKIVNSYTMEASFAGANFGKNKGKHFTTHDLEQMGHFFCDTILDYCDPDQSKVCETFHELIRLHRKFDSGDTDDASDSEEDNPTTVSMRRRRKTSKRGVRNRANGSKRTDSPSTGGSRKSSKRKKRRRAKTVSETKDDDKVRVDSFVSKAEKDASAAGHEKVVRRQGRRASSVSRPERQKMTKAGPGLGAAAIRAMQMQRQLSMREQFAESFYDADEAEEDEEEEEEEDEDEDLTDVEEINSNRACEPNERAPSAHIRKTSQLVRQAKDIREAAASLAAATRHFHNTNTVDARSKSDTGIPRSSGPRGAFGKLPSSHRIRTFGGATRLLSSLASTKSMSSLLSSGHFPEFATRTSSYVTVDGEHTGISASYSRGGRMAGSVSLHFQERPIRSMSDHSLLQKRAHRKLASQANATHNGCGSSNSGSSTSLPTRLPRLVSALSEKHS
eukprot:g1519.t1